MLVGLVCSGEFRILLLDWELGVGRRVGFGVEEFVLGFGVGQWDAYFSGRTGWMWALGWGFRCYRIWGLDEPWERCNIVSEFSEFSDT